MGPYSHFNKFVLVLLARKCRRILSDMNFDERAAEPSVRDVQAPQVQSRQLHSALAECTRTSSSSKPRGLSAPKQVSSSRGVSEYDGVLKVFEAQRQYYWIDEIPIQSTVGPLDVLFGVRSLVAQRECSFAGLRWNTTCLTDRRRCWIGSQAPFGRFGQLGKLVRWRRFLYFVPIRLKCVSTKNGVKQQIRSTNRVLSVASAVEVRSTFRFGSFLLAASACGDEDTNTASETKYRDSTDQSMGLEQTLRHDRRHGRCGWLPQLARPMGRMRQHGRHGYGQHGRC